MPCSLRELIVKVLSILETVDVRELVGILGVSVNDVVNSVSGLITMEGDTVKLNEAGIKEASGINCEVEAYGRLYEYYRAKPRSLERDVAIAEYGYRYAEYLNFPKDVSKEVLEVCLRLARFGFGSNVAELARKYGVRAFIVGLRAGDYCSAIDGLSYAVRKADPLGLMPFIGQAMSINKELIKNCIINYVGLMLHVGDGFISRNYFREVLRFIDDGLRTLSNVVDEVTCYLRVRLLNTKAQALTGIGNYEEAISDLNKSLDTLNKCAMDEITRRRAALEIMDRLGVVNYMTGNYAEASRYFLSVLNESVRLGEESFAASSNHNYVKSTILSNVGCTDYSRYLESMSGWSLYDSLRYYSSINDNANLSKVKLLIAVLLIGVGKFDETFKVINDGYGGEVHRFLKELLELLLGKRDFVNTDYVSMRLTMLGNFVNQLIQLFKLSSDKSLGEVINRELHPVIYEILTCRLPKLLLLL
ncbi:tetratricopeptide repeat protein [Vulcanisaeta souniana]|uniref:Tetratricopeptide repeat protein n=1 Tax=Vulcanisaeta souniana JCM 11219 TaxID=1293586 RepID=A0A830E0G3_9CREN|nr:tetratricopeptide repeat protein [Vulcanisaeta souniana]BDR91790.1 hypothetical protein Vsou_08830 [Vulcanisaeta souniana JCM 11219]GGI70358.1 hypothetical protein GCM10007112_04160 [Vulcanisaeta souniana JCM 11219]